jgi:hypothetical protein
MNQGKNRIGYLRLLQETGKTPILNFVFSFFPTISIILEKTNRTIVSLKKFINRKGRGVYAKDAEAFFVTLNFIAM